MHVLSRRIPAGAAIIMVCFCVPRSVAAQEYDKWYKPSEQHFLELKQKAKGGTIQPGTNFPTGRASGRTKGARGSIPKSRTTHRPAPS